MAIVRLAGWSRLLQSDGSTPFQLSLIDALGNRRPLEVQATPGLRPKYLELEMLAAGFDVQGDKKQKNDVSSPVLIYRWSISPQHSGKFEIGLALRGEDAVGQVWEFGVITRNVTVFKLAGLTNRQIVMVTSGFGVFSGLFAILQVASKVGLVKLAP
jgi:hypothetical protein